MILLARHVHPKILAVAVALSLMGLATQAAAQATNGVREIRIGSELDFRPYCFTDEKGRPAGFGVELLKAVTDKMGLPSRITSGPWDKAWNSLVTGEIDVLPVVARTPSREPLVDFSLPHTETFDAFFRRKGKPEWPDIAAAEGREIVVLRSDAAHHELVERGFTGRIIPVDSIPEGLRLVGAEKHDAMLCSKLVGVLECEKGGIRGVHAGPPIPDYKRVFSFGVSRGNPELLEKLNQGLLIVKASGDYDRIYRRWLVAEEPWRRWIPFFRMAVAALIALGGLAIILQWLVRKRTRELVQAKSELQHLNAALERRVEERTMALREANERFELVLEGAEAGIWDWDVVNKKVVYSTQWKTLRGYADHEIGNSEEEWRKGIHPEDVPRVWAALQAHFEGKTEFFAMEYRVRRKDGSWLWISDRGVARRDAAGHVFRMAGSETDISERKREEDERAEAEEEARSQQRQLSLAMEAGELIPWEINLSSGVVRTTPGLLKAFGLVEGAGLSLREQWRALILEDDRARVFESVEAAKKGQRYHIEYRFRHPDGSIHWHESHAVPIADASGTYTRLVGYLRDITERKRAEQELYRVAEDLKRLNEDLQHFVHIASHDLQEPLRMVSGFLSLLEEDYGPRLDEKARDYIRFSVESATRMSQLIHDLLDYSKAGRGKELEPTEAGQALAPALANLKAAIADAGAVVTHDALPVVLGDPTQLPQLFQNLLGNAIKFRSPERPCRVHVGVEKKENEWVFSIRDNGIGISPDHFERIFEIFQRLHTRDEYAGTGIGLSICKRIVERHGGRIWIESAPGQGTTFFFTLPAAPGTLP